MRLWAVMIAVGAFFAPSLAVAACRLALVLALDVSGSVDEEEYALQLNGVAEALVDPAVREAFLASSAAPVTLAIFEWSSSSYQREIVGWTPITTAADLEAVRSVLRGWKREAAPEATGLGAALLHATRLFQTGPACWRRTLDISADGKNNDWPVPTRLRTEGRLGDMTVNALVVARDFQSTLAMTPNGVTELSAYFQTRIIHGPGAFIEVAIGYDDYARAMRRKLLRELATMPLGWLPQTNGPVRALFAPARAQPALVAQ